MPSGGVAPLGHGKRDGTRWIQVIAAGDDAGDSGRVRSGHRPQSPPEDIFRLWLKNGLEEVVRDGEEADWAEEAGAL